MRQNPKADLSELLNAYFGDQTPQEGAAELVFGSRNSIENHQFYLSTLKAGIDAARCGESWVKETVNRSWARLVYNSVEAKEFLEEVLAAYNDRYAAALAAEAIQSKEKAKENANNKLA